MQMHSGGFQREGCESHVLHPDLVPWKRKDGPDQWTAIYEINGVDLANGEGDAANPAVRYTSMRVLRNCAFGVGNPAACAGGHSDLGFAVGVHPAELRQRTLMGGLWNG
jgi:hypothetical protein